jgi:triphosphoribosyl-dephospho-CoA synthase
MAIMTSLSDTCVLSRAGMAGLTPCRHGAGGAGGGGSATARARRAGASRRQMLALNASPGGAADLLAATLFLDRVSA